jgi:putative flippase GtrA
MPSALMSNAGIAARLREPALHEFVCFGIVGAAGFIANVVTVYIAQGLLGLYGAGLAAYVIAATVTWTLNRSWTFRSRGAMPIRQQWVLFLAANSLGFALYYVTYATLVAISAICRAFPIIAVFCGMLSGMFCNFTLSRKYVFR